MMSDMILYDVKQAVEQVKNTKLIVSEMRRDVLVKDVDYGIIPGTTKPTLLKPGAERLCTAFGLCPEFEPISQIEDFENGIFYYRYRCSLIHIATGKKIATGIGSCNSKEDKYRWRNEECPNCKKQKIAKSKYPDRNTGAIGWYCNACKASFPPGQFSGAREENTDPFSIINTIDKMATKRALIAAVLIGTNASEFFTQDVEDLPRFAEEDVIDADFVEPERKAEPLAKAKSTPATKSQSEQSPIQPPQGEPPTNGNSSTYTELAPRQPDDLKAWFQGQLRNTNVRGTMQGTITEGQQRNLAITMSDYFKHRGDAFRIDFLNYHFGSEARKITSSAQLHDKEMAVLKLWLNNTDGEQVVKEVALFEQKLQTQATQAAPDDAAAEFANI
jgi:hypothetical protein